MASKLILLAALFLATLLVSSQLAFAETESGNVGEDQYWGGGGGPGYYGGRDRGYYGGRDRGYYGGRDRGYYGGRDRGGRWGGGHPAEDRDRDRGGYYGGRDHGRGDHGWGGGRGGHPAGNEPQN